MRLGTDRQTHRQAHRQTEIGTVSLPSAYSRNAEIGTFFTERLQTLTYDLDLQN